MYIYIYIDLSKNHSISYVTIAQPTSIIGTCSICPSFPSMPSGSSGYGGLHTTLPHDLKKGVEPHHTGKYGCILQY